MTGTRLPTHAVTLRVWVQGVVFESNRVAGKPAGNQVVAVSSSQPRTTIYAEPRLRVWQWPLGGLTSTKPRLSTTRFLSKTVAPVAAAMRRVQLVCP